MPNLNFHIMIVEDNEQLGSMYERFLQLHNYRTMRLINAQDAINQFIPFDPDLICLDWALADGNCEPFLQYLSTLEAKNRPPILLISAQATLENIERYRHCITDVLPKPISMKELLKRVETLTPLAEQRVRFEQIQYKQIGANGLYMQWIGNISPQLIRELMHPKLIEAKTVVFDIRQLNTMRFQVQPFNHPMLPELQAIFVICNDDQRTFATYLIQSLNNASSAKIFYHSDPEQAVFAAIQYKG